MKVRHFVAASLLALATLPATAGDAVTVTGEAVYFSPLTESPQLARQRAIEQARLETIDKAFPKSVSQHSVMVESSHNEEAKSHFQCYGECDVRGEWLQDIEEPVVTEERVANGTNYTVRVRGKAREIPNDRIDLDCRLLCNGTDAHRNRVRNNAFYVGDEMYLYFMSPVDGYLTVYLGDDDDDLTFQALIPYDGMQEQAYPIKGGQEYVFFSKALAEPQYVQYASRMIMDARKNVDSNMLYVVFSPNAFGKAHDTRSRDAGAVVNYGGQDYNLMPRETTFKNFHKWLSKKRVADRQMQIVKEIITIEQQ